MRVATLKRYCCFRSFSKHLQSLSTRISLGKTPRIMPREKYKMSCCLKHVMYAKKRIFDVLLYLSAGQLTMRILEVYTRLSYHRPKLRIF